MGLFDFLVSSKDAKRYGLAPRSDEQETSYGQLAGLNKKNFAEAPDFSQAFRETTDFGSRTQAQANDLTSGAFLDPGSSVNRGFIEATNRPLIQSFKEQTIPGLESYLAKSGGTEGSRGTDLIRQAYRDFEQVLGDTSSKSLATIGGVRAAGFQAGAQGGAAGGQSVLNLLTGLTNTATQQFNMAQGYVQTGGKSVGSAGEALGTIGSAAVTAAAIYALSDRRLKSNIVRIGTHRLGIGLYEYDLLGHRTRGVMADEVETVKPEAVGTLPGGYKFVDYAKL